MEKIKDDSTKKMTRVGFRVTPTEKQFLEESAKQNNMTLSQLVRSLIPALDAPNAD